MKKIIFSAIILLAGVFINIACAQEIPQVADFSKKEATSLQSPELNSKDAKNIVPENSASDTFISQELANIDFSPDSLKIVAETPFFLAGSAYLAGPLLGQSILGEGFRDQFIKGYEKELEKDQAQKSAKENLAVNKDFASGNYDAVVKSLNESIISNLK